MPITVEHPALARTPARRSVRAAVMASEVSAEVEPRAAPFGGRCESDAGGARIGRARGQQDNGERTAGEPEPGDEHQRRRRREAARLMGEFHTLAARALGAFAE